MEKDTCEVIDFFWKKIFVRSLIFLEKDICEVIDAPLERGRPDDPGDLTSATHTSGQRITKGGRFFLSFSLFKDIFAWHHFEKLKTMRYWKT